MGAACSSQQAHMNILSSVAVVRVSMGSNSTSQKGLTKRDSDMNLVPVEVHKQWFQSDESRCEREKHMLVLCTSTSAAIPSRLVIVDVEQQQLSKNSTYGKVIQQLVLPSLGDELIYSTFIASRQMSMENQHSANGFYLSSLIVPCHNSNRIYIVGIDNQLQLRVRRVGAGRGCVELGRGVLQPHLKIPNQPLPVPVHDQGRPLQVRPERPTLGL